MPFNVPKCHTLQFPTVYSDNMANARNVPLTETYEYSVGPLWLAYQLCPSAPVYNPTVATTHNTHYARCAVRTLILMATYAKRP